MTTIRYFIPEDGDSEEHPNIFLLPKSNSGFSPRLRDVKDAFPVPGNYLFRFKSPIVPGADRDKNAVSVWMDCVDDDQHVGVWKNAIFAKVTRIGMNDDDEDEADFVPQHNSNGYAPTQSSPSRQSTPSTRSTTAPTSTRTHPPQPTATASENPEPLLGFDDPSPASMPSSVSTSENNLLDVGAESVGGAQGPEGSLLDMTAPSSYNSSSNHSIASSGHAASDFLGMTASPTTQPITAEPKPTYKASVPKPTPPPPVSNGGALNNAFKGPFGDLEWK